MGTTGNDCFGAPIGLFHMGFWKASEFVFKSISHYLLTDTVSKGTIHFIGHSYGGAVASILCVMMARSHSPRPFRGCSYGAPPSMDSTAASIVKAKLFSISNGCDFVPCLGFTPVPVLLQNSPKLRRLVTATVDLCYNGAILAPIGRWVMAVLSESSHHELESILPFFIRAFQWLLGSEFLQAFIARALSYAAKFAFAILLFRMILDKLPKFVPAGISIHIGDPGNRTQAIDQSPYPSQVVTASFDSPGILDHTAAQYTRAVIGFIEGLGPHRE
jgi:hypothetical protein